MPLWRPDKNYVKGRRRTAQVREDVPRHHLRVLCQAGQLEVVPDVRQGTGRALDECGVRAPPAQGLDANPAGASEKIQEAAAQKAGREDIEKALLRAVRDRAGIPRSRRSEPAALSRSCNNPHVKTRTLRCLTFGGITEHVRDSITPAPACHVSLQAATPADSGKAPGDRLRADGRMAHPPPRVAPAPQHD